MLHEMWRGEKIERGDTAGRVLYIVRLTRVSARTPSRRIACCLPRTERSPEVPYRKADSISPGGEQSGGSCRVDIQWSWQDGEVEREVSTDGSDSQQIRCDSSFSEPECGKANDEEIEECWQ